MHWLAQEIVFFLSQLSSSLLSKRQCDVQRERYERCLLAHFDSLSLSSSVCIILCDESDAYRTTVCCVLYDSVHVAPGRCDDFILYAWLKHTDENGQIYVCNRERKQAKNGERDRGKKTTILALTHLSPWIYTYFYWEKINLLVAATAVVIVVSDSLNMCR